jgi:hypothetical protein
LRGQALELERLGALVYAVSFESRGRVTEFQAGEPLPFPLLRDPSRSTYRAFGLGRRPATTIWGPRTLWYYVWQVLRGRLPSSSAGRDPYQLGGDVILKADQSGGWIYGSRHPADRPEPAAILAVIRRARDDVEPHASGVES